MPSQAEKLTALLEAKRAYDESAAAIALLEQAGVMSPKEAQKVVASVACLQHLCINFMILI